MKVQTSTPCIIRGLPSPRASSQGDHSLVIGIKETTFQALLSLQALAPVAVHGSGILVGHLTDSCPSGPSAPPSPQLSSSSVSFSARACDRPLPGGSRGVQSLCWQLGSQPLTHHHHHCTGGVLLSSHSGCSLPWQASSG